MARTSVRGTPYTHIKASNTEGQRPGIPMGSDGQTSMQQFRGTGMSTTQSSGTPYRSEAGNGPETMRMVSSDRYGMVEDRSAGNLSDPKSNGDGVVLDGMTRDYASPPVHPALDSPVPSGAPVFMTDNIPRVNDMRNGVGIGAGPVQGRDNLLDCGGVMSRGMVGTSSSSGPETELTDDDVLPASAPAGR